MTELEMLRQAASAVVGDLETLVGVCTPETESAVRTRLDALRDAIEATKGPDPSLPFVDPYHSWRSVRQVRREAGVEG
jgi:hypothetical protein